MNKKNIIAVIVIIVLVVSVFILRTYKEKALVPYVDPISEFSITLPKEWIIQTKTIATTTSNVQFSNGSSTVVVKRFPRTEKVEQAIAFMGDKAFLLFMADQLKEDIEGYNIVATSTVTINSVDYLKVVGKYTGKSSQKEVTQNAYISLTDDAYYILGTDVYSDMWDEYDDRIFDIVDSFKLL